MQDGDKKRVKRGPGQPFMDAEVLAILAKRRHVDYPNGLMVVYCHKLKHTITTDLNGTEIQVKAPRRVK